MQVLFLSTWFPFPPDNGSKLRVYHLLRSLARSHDVTLVSFAFDTACPEQPSELRSWCRDVLAVPVNPFAVNRTSTLRTFLSPVPVASRPVSAMSRQVADVLAAHSFDVVIASTEMMAGYALQVPPSAARILEEHNSMTRWMEERCASPARPPQRLRRWVSWQKTRRYEARLFRRFDLVTMVSEQDRIACLAGLPGYRGPVKVIPNGVDCAHNRPGLASTRAGALVYNGSMTYSANYDAVQWFLAEIYPGIRAQVPAAALTVTGSTANVDLAGLALDDTVHLTGYVPDVRLPVAEASVCIAPIREGGGTRLKILEAMALGTPVVATSKGAEGLAVTHGEQIVIADEPAEFAAQTVRLLCDESERRRLAANARRLVEAEYDWGRIGMRFVALIEETVAAHRRKRDADA